MDFRLVIADSLIQIGKYMFYHIIHRYSISFFMKKIVIYFILYFSITEMKGWKKKFNNADFGAPKTIKESP